jgi:hypothetical protein
MIPCRRGINEDGRPNNRPNAPKEAQSGNAPGLDGGSIVNRVRELKPAETLYTPTPAMCDTDAAGDAASAARGDSLELVEDAVFGGLPTDRTVLKPDPKMVPLTPVPSMTLCTPNRCILDSIARPVDSLA